VRRSRVFQPTPTGRGSRRFTPERTWQGRRRNSTGRPGRPVLPFQLAVEEQCVAEQRCVGYAGRLSGSHVAPYRPDASRKGFGRFRAHRACALCLHLPKAGTVEQRTAHRTAATPAARSTTTKAIGSGQEKRSRWCFASARSRIGQYRPQPVTRRTIRGAQLGRPADRAERAGRARTARSNGS
jgi:hypothetical protein